MRKISCARFLPSGDDSPLAFFHHDELALVMAAIETASSATGQSEEEPALRLRIKERPKNGRAMAKLAHLLGERAKLCSEIEASSLQHEALGWAKRSVQVAPEKPYGYMSLSVLEADHVRRMQALRKAIERHHEDDSAFVKLGLLIRLLFDPRYNESLQVGGRIGRASCSHPGKRPLDASEEVLYERIAKALDDFWRRTTTESTQNQQQMAETEYRLGLFFRKRQPVDISRARAQLHLQRSLQHLPTEHENWAVAEFWLGTLGNNDKPVNRCPASYVVGLYSTFAERFDDLLVAKLEYQTPTVLRKLVDETMTSNKKFGRGLDLGCGTGLSGLAFRDRVQDLLIGVDLSPEMIAKARERKCYDALEVGDVTNCLASHAIASFDLIFACDVFVYLGGLKKVFLSVYNVLSSHGVFAFSTELLTEEDGDNTSDTDFVLHECARFSHSRSYIERLANECSFDVLKMSVSPLRKNQGKDVVGLLTILTRRERNENL